MRRPERLLFFDSRPDGERSRLSVSSDDTLIEAVFIDRDIPIVFRARLPFEDREFFADRFSTNEASAEYFSGEELLDACFNAGPVLSANQWCMTPEHTEHTDETRALMKQCDWAAEGNDVVYLR